MSVVVSYQIRFSNPKGQQPRSRLCLRLPTKIANPPEAVNTQIYTFFLPGHHPKERREPPSMGILTFR